jgi:hypothetical protein
MAKWLRKFITLFALLACLAGVAVAGPGYGSDRPGKDGDPDGPMLNLPTLEGGQELQARRSAVVPEGATTVVRTKQDAWIRTVRAYLRLYRWFSI